MTREAQLEALCREIYEELSYDLPSFGMQGWSARAATVLATPPDPEHPTVKTWAVDEAQRQRVVALEAQVRVLREALLGAQSLGSASIGQRNAANSEWRIPWNKQTVGVFSNIAKALAATDPARGSGG